MEGARRLDPDAHVSDKLVVGMTLTVALIECCVVCLELSCLLIASHLIIIIIHHPLLINELAECRLFRLLPLIQALMAS